MRRTHVFLLCVLVVVCLSSCMTIGDSPARQFSLSQTQKSPSSSGVLRGTVNYGVGYYFPTSSDIVDIALLKTDSITGLVTEITHSRIRGPGNFPVQFSMFYDKADISDDGTYTLIVSFLVDNEVKRQTLMLLNRTDDGFAEASLTLLGI